MNVLLAMLITVTVFFQVIEQRFICYRLKYIRNCFIISIPVHVYTIIKGVLFVGRECGGTPLLPPCDLSATYFKLATSLFMFRNVY